MACVISCQVDSYFLHSLFPTSSQPFFYTFLSKCLMLFLRSVWPSSFLLVLHAFFLHAYLSSSCYSSQGHSLLERGGTAKATTYTTPPMVNLLLYNSLTQTTADIDNRCRPWSLPQSRTFFMESQTHFNPVFPFTS